MKLSNILFEVNEITKNKIIDIQTEDGNGSLSANVHNDMNRVINWAEKERLSSETKQKLSELPLPVAILKNVWVDEESRGQGVGSELMSKFFDEAEEASSFVLIADSEQTQNQDFNLAKWYEGYGFETIGESGSGPVMVYIP
jgi:predicted GNAT family N-acyltransferase